MNRTQGLLDLIGHRSKDAIKVMAEYFLLQKLITDEEFAFVIEAIDEDKKVNLNELVEQGEELTRVAERIPMLLHGKKDDSIVEFLSYVLKWNREEGTFNKGDIRKDDNDYPFICINSHNSLDNPNFTINERTLWAPCHAKSKEHALPWIQPTGAHDMYEAGEFMIWEDGTTRKCKQDTVYNPNEYPQAWEIVTDTEPTNKTGVQRK